MKKLNFFSDFTENITYTFNDVITFIPQHFSITPATYKVGEKQNTRTEKQNSLAVLLYCHYMDFTVEQYLALYTQHH